METEALFKGFATLGPALGSVLVSGVLCYFLIQLVIKVLEMFNKHGDTLKTINENMSAHTSVIKDLSNNVSINTKATEQIVNLLARRR